MKTLWMNQSCHRPAQSIRDAETALAVLVVRIIHLNLAIVRCRDPPPATKQRSSRFLLPVKFQANEIDSRCVASQLEAQATFQSAQIRPIQVSRSIDNLNSHASNFLAPGSTSLRHYCPSYAMSP